MLVGEGRSESSIILSVLEVIMARFEERKVLDVGMKARLCWEDKRKDKFLPVEPSQPRWKGKKAPLMAPRVVVLVW